MHESGDIVNNANTPKPKKLLERARDVLRLQHYSIRTEEAYLGWMKRYILFHGKRYPEAMGMTEIEAFLTHLAVEGDVAASTQNQALNALLFLYRKVLDRDLADQKVDSLRARKKPRLPTVLTQDETRRVISAMSGQYQLMAKLLYGSGLRLMECIRLRVQDLDFGMNELTVRDGKGDNGRITLSRNRCARFYIPTWNE